MNAKVKNTPLTAAKAKEIIEVEYAYNLGDYSLSKKVAKLRDTYGPRIAEALGYLAALNGPEVKSLIEAFEKLAHFTGTIGLWDQPDDSEKLAGLMLDGREALEKFKEAVEK